MSSKSSISDVFGDPVPPVSEGLGKRGRGRPQHIATQENCNKVNLLLALGWSEESIARALGVAAPTLRKQYAQVLQFREEKRARLEASLAMKLWEGVQAGNIAAIKEFRAFLDRTNLVSMAYVGLRAADGQIREPKLGKKELALLAAQQPDTDTTIGELMAQRLPDKTDALN